MKKVFTALLLAVIDGLILVKYPFDPSAGTFSSAILAGGAIFIIFGLLCILCSEKLGGFTGPVGSDGYVSHATPGGMFVFFGFLLLLLPVIAVGCQFFTADSDLPTIRPVTQ